MFSHYKRKCLNPECERLVIGHRCSGYCSKECLEKTLKQNEEKLALGNRVEIKYGNINNYYKLYWR